MCKHDVFYFILKWHVIGWGLRFTLSLGSTRTCPHPPSGSGSGVCTLSKGTFFANLVKSVLTFGAERLITAFSNGQHVCRDEVQSRGQGPFSHSVNLRARLSTCECVQHKGSFNLMTFFLQGHKNEMDTVLSFVLFHLLTRFSFSRTVKACMPFRVLRRSKTPSCRIKTNIFLPK